MESNQDTNISYSQAPSNENNEVVKKNITYEIFKSTILFLGMYPLTFFGFFGILQIKVPVLTAIIISSLITLFYRLRLNVRGNFLLPTIGLLYLLFFLPKSISSTNFLGINNQLTYLFLLIVLGFYIYYAILINKMKKEEAVIQAQEAINKEIEGFLSKKVWLEKTDAIIIILIFLIPFLLEIYAWNKPFFEWVENNLQISSKICGNRMKQCPDGSYVFPAIPKCEFAPCQKINTASITPTLFPKLTFCSKCSSKYKYQKDFWLEKDSICDKSSVDFSIIPISYNPEEPGVRSNIDCSCKTGTEIKSSMFTEFCETSQNKCSKCSSNYKYEKNVWVSDNCKEIFPESSFWFNIDCNCQTGTMIAGGAICNYPISSDSNPQD